MTIDLVNKDLLVTLAAGIHPDPSRTRQLSPPAPMVLGGRPPGRVGRCQEIFACAYLSDVLELPSLCNGGASPSGKARDFGSRTRRFESYRPSSYSDLSQTATRFNVE